MKKFNLLIALILVFTLTLTACSSGEDTTGDTSSDSKVETDTEAPSKEEVKESADASELEGELVYWSMWNPTEPQAIAIAEGIDMFMEMHPGVTVEIQWNGREIRQTLQPALDNGQLIDIWDEDLERVTKTWGDYALSVEPYLSNTYANTNGKAYSEAVMGSLIEMGRGHSESGELMAVPYQPFVIAFMYNKDHFDQAGIDSVPATWDELMAACEKLKAAGFTPMTIDDAYMDLLPGYHLSRLKGTDWVGELVNDSTNAMWDDPAVIQMAEDYEELVANGYMAETAGSNVWPSGQQDIAAGTVSMYLNGTWLVNEIMPSTGEDFNWGTFAYPAVEGGVDGTNAAIYGSQAFQINKDTKYPEVAMELLAHLTTGHYDNFIAKSSYGVPVSGDAEWPPQLEEAKTIFAGLDTVYPWAGNIGNNAEKHPVIVDNFTKLISGSITAEEFVSNMK